jgi:hypothetical protein
VILAAVLPPGGGRPWRNRLAGLGAGLLGLLVVAGPWMGAAAVRHGRLELVPGKSAAVLAGIEERADPGGAPAESSGPGGAALRAAASTADALHPVPAAFVLLGLVSLAALGRCGRQWGPVLLQALAAATFVGGVALLEWRYGYGGRRHASTAAVALLPFAGPGMLLAGRLLARLGGPLRRPVVALGLIALGTAAPLAAGALLRRDVPGLEAREVGLRIRALAVAGAMPRVATFGEPRVAWYAGGADVPLLREFGVPRGSPAEEARRRADALRWFLQGRTRADFVALRDGDRRVPPGFPGRSAGPPDAVSGALRAWRVERLR